MTASDLYKMSQKVDPNLIEQNNWVYHELLLPKLQAQARMNNTQLILSNTSDAISTELYDKFGISQTLGQYVWSYMRVYLRDLGFSLHGNEYQTSISFEPKPQL